jgi:hypothetical protein
LDIDAVVAWVDGDDPAHRARRAPYIKADSTSLPEATSPTRFVGSNEIIYCLRSILNHAPWIRRVWVITDNQRLPVMQSLARLCRVHVVDHTSIFRGFEHLLPTFNSLSIETMMWRIPGLAEHFIYFNDDMGICSRVQPVDFFRNGKSMARGRWGSYSREQRGTWESNQQVAAEMMGYCRENMFIDAHVPKALSRSLFQHLFDRDPDAFIKNASYRFRNPEQFLPVGLHEHAALADGLAELWGTRDWLHFSIKNCRKDPFPRVGVKMNDLISAGKKLYCINDYKSLKKRFPIIEICLEHATGPAQPYERQATIKQRLRLVGNLVPS